MRLYTSPLWHRVPHTMFFFGFGLREWDRYVFPSMLAWEGLGLYSSSFVVLPIEEKDKERGREQLLLIFIW